MDDQNVNNGRKLVETRELLDARCSIISVALTKMQPLLHSEEARELVEGLEYLAKFLAYEASSLRLQFKVKDL
jgi:hypothetical protein